MNLGAGMHRAECVFAFPPFLFLRVRLNGWFKEPRASNPRTAVGRKLLLVRCDKGYPVT